METAALPASPRPSGLVARARTAGADAWAKIAFAALSLATAVGIIVYPTYPNYDSYYSLLWGRELLHGEVPHFEGFRIPTEHPLAIAAGAVLSVFGEVGDRLWIALTFGAFLALVAGIYQIGRVAFTPIVGIVAALLLLSRFDFAFLAARGYIDIPYMALVVWALALEAGRPRRGTPVFALLTSAGLVRPEAWLLSGLYFLWMSWGAGWRERARWAAWTAAAPLGWCAVDLAVTGDPLFSLHYTSDSAEDLGRSRTLGELPAAIPDFLAHLVKLPVLLAGVLGLGVAAALVPRRVVWPAVLLLTGLLTFAAIGVAGLSVIERYLIVASLALLVLAAFAIGGWSLLGEGGYGLRARRWWIALASLAVAYGVGTTLVNLDLRHFDDELRFRGDAHAALSRLLADPDVVAALRCGPLTLPNHKLVPDARWISGRSFDDVWARAQQFRKTDRRRPARAGVAVYVTSRFAIFKQAFTDDSDPAVIQVPPDGWSPVARTEYYTAYARC